MGYSKLAPHAMRRPGARSDLSLVEVEVDSVADVNHEILHRAGLSPVAMTQKLSSHEIERLWVHTNTLDHPRALPLYQKLGFVPYAQEKAEIVPID